MFTMCRNELDKRKDQVNRLRQLAKLCKCRNHEQMKQQIQDSKSLTAERQACQGTLKVQTNNEREIFLLRSSKNIYKNAHLFWNW